MISTILILLSPTPTTKEIEKRYIFFSSKEKRDSVYDKIIKEYISNKTKILNFGDSIYLKSRIIGIEKKDVSKKKKEIEEGTFDFFKITK